MSEIRKIREAEKATYLEANGTTLSDARERWRAYEDLILKKYGPVGVRRVQALDVAWARRDRYHELGK